MRLRNIIIILVINYLCLLVVSGFMESNSLATKAKNLQMLIRTAADMALEQSQVVDDFLSYGGRDTYTIKMPSSNGSGFVETDLFEGVFGITSRVDSNKERIFSSLYNNNDFKMLSLRLEPIEKPVRYWNLSRNGFSWYYIPTISMMGTDILPSGRATKGIKDMYGNYVPESFASEIFQIYGLDSHVHTSGGREYYNTPINLGITYLNEHLLGTLFMNNLDLLMRQKYNSNLNTADGGDGILEGETFSDYIRGDLDEYNPINNGEFTILRGQQNPNVVSVKSFPGVKPLVLYKVIDMYDSRNDAILIDLFGPRKGSFSSKAEYLKDLDRHVLNPVTMRPYETKPFVVAKATFYVDVIVPYFSVVMRELRSNVVEGSTNFIDLVPEDPEGVAGTRRISYTRYFAVSP